MTLLTADIQSCQLCWACFIYLQMFLCPRSSRLIWRKSAVIVKWKNSEVNHYITPPPKKKKKNPDWLFIKRLLVSLGCVQCPFAMPVMHNNPSTGILPPPLFFLIPCFKVEVIHAWEYSMHNKIKPCETSVDLFEWHRCGLSVTLFWMHSGRLYVTAMLTRRANIHLTHILI